MPERIFKRLVEFLESVSWENQKLEFREEKKRNRGSDSRDRVEVKIGSKIFVFLRK